MDTLVKMNFQPAIAKDVGTDAAIIYENICYWVARNKANEKHFHDGRYWTYNSNKAFLELFTWLTTDKIRTCLKKLKEKNYIVTGNYNKSNYDKTLWYSQFDMVKIPNGEGENPEPIPNTKPNNKPNNIPSFSENESSAQAFEEFWLKYPHKKNQSKKQTKVKYENLYSEKGEEWHKKVLGAIESQAVKRKQAKGFIPDWKHAVTWLNQECWDMEVGEEEKTYSSEEEELRAIGRLEFGRKYGTEKRNKVIFDILQNTGEIFF